MIKAPIHFGHKTMKFIVQKKESDYFQINEKSCTQKRTET